MLLIHEWSVLLFVEWCLLSHCRRRMVGVEHLLEYITHIVNIVDMHHHMCGCFLNDELHCDSSFRSFFVVRVLLNIYQSSLASPVLHLLYFFSLINRPVYFELLVIFYRCHFWTWVAKCSSWDISFLIHAPFDDSRLVWVALHLITASPTHWGWRRDWQFTRHRWLGEILARHILRLKSLVSGPTMKWVNYSVGNLLILLEEASLSTLLRRRGAFTIVLMKAFP